MPRQRQIGRRLTHCSLTHSVGRFKKARNASTIASPPPATSGHPRPPPSLRDQSIAPPSAPLSECNRGDSPLVLTPWTRRRWAAGRRVCPALPCNALPALPPAPFRKSFRRSCSRRCRHRGSFISIIRSGQVGGGGGGGGGLQCKCRRVRGRKERGNGSTVLAGALTDYIQLATMHRLRVET